MVEDYSVLQLGMLIHYGIAMDSENFTGPLLSKGYGRVKDGTSLVARIFLIHLTKVRARKIEKTVHRSRDELRKPCPVNCKCQPVSY